MSIFTSPQQAAKHLSNTLVLPSRHREASHKIRSEMGIEDLFETASAQPLLPLQKPLEVACDFTQAKPSTEVSETVLFGTGDMFAVLRQDPKNRDVNVCLKLAQAARFDIPSQLYGALEMCWAARENGARQITLELPENLDPVLHPSALATLTVKMAKACGVREIRYTASATETSTASSSVDESLNQLQVSLRDATTKVELACITKQLKRSAKYVSRRGGDVSPYDTLLSAAKTLAPSLAKTDGSARRVVFVGGANPQLGQAFVQELRQADSSTVLAQHRYDPTWPNADFDTDVGNATVTIIQGTRPDLGTPEADNYTGASRYLFETLMLAQLAHERGARRIEIVFSYQPSARSDKRETKPHNYVGAYACLVGRFADQMRINQTVLVESHDSHAPSYFTNKFNRGSMVQGLNYLVQKLVDSLGADRSKAVLVAPDEGATKRTKALRDLLNIEMVAGQKTRSSHADDSATVTSLGSGKELDGDKIYIVSDDETLSGSTMAQTLSMLRKQGAEDIRVVLAHNNMPLNPVERNLCLARFMHKGARQIHFFDTQPMGPVVASWDELRKMGVRYGMDDARLRAWAEKNVFEGAIDDTTYATWQAEFAQLNQKINAHSVAALIAEELTLFAPPPAARFAEPLQVQPALRGAFALGSETPKAAPISQDLLQLIARGEAPVIVGSTSPLKLQAAESYVRRLLAQQGIVAGALDIRGFAAASGIAEQPLSAAEGKTGATTRNRLAYKMAGKPANALVLAYENYIEEVPVTVPAGWDFPDVYVRDGSAFIDSAAITVAAYVSGSRGAIEHSQSASVLVPRECAEAAQAGGGARTAGSIIAERYGVDAADWHRDFVGQSRADILAGT